MYVAEVPGLIYVYCIVTVTHQWKQNVNKRLQYNKVIKITTIGVWRFTAVSILVQHLYIRPWRVPIQGGWADSDPYPRTLMTCWDVVPLNVRKKI